LTVIAINEDEYDRARQKIRKNMRRQQATMVRMMEQDVLRKKKLPGDTSLTVIKTCKGNKWRSALEVADLSGVSEENIARVIHLIQTSHKHRAMVETKRIGKEIHYRIFEKDKTVSVEELTTKLRPIVEGLKAEGKKNMATMVPAEVAMLAARLERLLNEWAE